LLDYGLMLSWEGVEKQFLPGETRGEEVSDGSGRIRRLFKKAVRQGRSERRGDAYSVPYVEPLSDARTPLADFFNSLQGGSHDGHTRDA
jgi:hypothetical protein